MPKAPKIPCTQNPFGLAGRKKRARTFTLANQNSGGQKLPHEMSYPTIKTLQYAVTPAQESELTFHMFRR